MSYMCGTDNASLADDYRKNIREQDARERRQDAEARKAEVERILAIAATYHGFSGPPGYANGYLWEDEHTKPAVREALAYCSEHRMIGTLSAKEALAVRIRLTRPECYLKAVQDTLDKAAYEHPEEQ